MNKDQKCVKEVDSVVDDIFEGVGWIFCYSFFVLFFGF